MPNLNRIFLIGNLTHEPKIKQTKSGKTVTTFSIAINHKYTDKDDKQQEKVCFIDIVAWNKLAEICGSYLKKGKPVFVEGNLEQNRWEQDGKKRSKIQVLARTIQFLSPK